MAAIIIGLSFCTVCSAVLRAPMFVLYFLAWLTATVLLLAVGYFLPALFLGILVLFFAINLDRFLERRG